MSHNVSHKWGILSMGAVAAAVLGGVVAAQPASAGGVSGPAFYVNHVLYRTVGTPTDLSGTGAPDQSWDTIYDFNGAIRSVATAAPGDAGYNGGRWQVHATSLPNGISAALASGDRDHDGVLDSADEVQAAMASGDVADAGIVKYFVCTVNPVPASQS